MQQTHFKSTVAIDLGANNTGVFLVNHYADDVITKENTKAATIVMPVEGSGLVYSMKNRTAVRHRMRGRKRFNLARRLLLLIVDELMKEKQMALSAQEYQKMVEALCGLLKRRGYSRVESETDLTILENVDPAVFATHPALSVYFNETQSVAEQWENITNNLVKVGAFCRDDSIPSDKDFKQFLNTDFPDYKSFAKSYTSALKVIKEDSKNIVNQQAMGHLHRTKYLENIKSEIEKDTRLKSAVELLGSTDRLHHLVGNISNLQLRATRWYFNAPEMVTQDKLTYPKLQKTLVRAFKYFHPTDANKEQLRALINELESSTDIVDTLCTMSPEKTIPPYEDQNNRRPPVDQTLWLNPLTLNKRYGENWKVWADRLQKADPELNSKLDEILQITDRKSRIAFNNPDCLDKKIYRLSYILQRALDRSRTCDPYCLRDISMGVLNSKFEKFSLKLESVIGSQHVINFLKFASDYYAEVELAKAGLWMANPQNLLERADIHPPMKNKILEILVGNVFGGDKSRGQMIMDHWHDKVHGNSSLVSICRSIEAVRKEYGGEFNSLYRAAVIRNQKAQKPESGDKDFLLIAKKVQLVTTFFSEKLGIPSAQVQRVSNPYSLAQLYTLIETERAGFTSTSLAAHLENAWRMSSNSTEQSAAQAMRLPADAVRPFDGALRRVLDRQAWEVAQLVRDELLSRNIQKNTPIDMMVLVEQNKFAFTASLATLKKNTKAQKKAEAKLEQQNQRWLSKEERIKLASGGICAYTGQSLGEFGEIDHIIPRSYTNNRYGTVFNSEVNLIYVSQKGNQDKKDRIYGLADLNKSYLKRHFGTDNISEIERRIESVVEELVEKGRLAYFDLLSADEQCCVRHALFLHDGSGAKAQVINILGNMRKARVNGTQAWFIRELISKVEIILKDWLKENGHQLTFNAKQADVQVSSLLRKGLSKVDRSFTKTPIQSVSSHAIDAMCAYAWACGVDSLCSQMSSNPNFADASEAQSLMSIFPESCKILNVEQKNPNEKKAVASRPIFKEGIIGQEFLPLIVKNGDIFVGFGLPKNGETSSLSAVKVQGKNPHALLSVLGPVLATDIDADNPTDGVYRINKQKAFDLLKTVSQTKVSVAQLQLANVLEALVFFTTKVEVLPRLLTTNQKKFKTQEEILKQKDFTIKLSIKNKDYRTEDSLQLPSYNDWKRICEMPGIGERLGADVGEFDLNKFIESTWTHSSKRQHHATRRVFSLPIIATSSGLVRIWRRSFDGNACVQASNVNGVKFKGFAMTDNGVDWKTPIIGDLFRSSRVNAHLDRFADNSEIVSMEAWREVYNDAIKIEVAPGSTGRRYIRITMSFDLFKDWTGCTAESYRALPAQLKLSDPKRLSEKAGALSELIGQPRSELFFEQIGDEVTFNYIVSSSNEKMNSTYNQGQAR